jgi:CBS-domain-containing membrane protein
LTTRVTVAECDSVPSAPVIVRGYVPVGVVVAVEIVSVELPEVETDAGLKLAVAPLGKPLTLRFTVPVKPLSAPMVVV